MDWTNLPSYAAIALEGVAGTSWPRAGSICCAVVPLAARAAASAGMAGDNHTIIAVRNGADRLSKKFPWPRVLVISMEDAHIRVVRQVRFIFTGRFPSTGRSSTSTN